MAYARQSPILLDERALDTVLNSARSSQHGTNDPARLTTIHEGQDQASSWDQDTVSTDNAREQAELDGTVHVAAPVIGPAQAGGGGNNASVTIPDGHGSSGRFIGPLQVNASTPNAPPLTVFEVEYNVLQARLTAFDSFTFREAIMMRDALVANNIDEPEALQELDRLRPIAREQFTMFMVRENDIEGKRQIALRSALPIRDVSSLTVLVTLHDLAPDEKDCSICQNPYGSRFTDPPELAVRLTRCCKNLLGQGCLHTWLQSKTTCPLCRHDYGTVLPPFQMAGVFPKPAAWMSYMSVLSVFKRLVEQDETLPMRLRLNLWRAVAGIGLRTSEDGAREAVREFSGERLSFYLRGLPIGLSSLF